MVDHRILTETDMDLLGGEGIEEEKYKDPERALEQRRIRMRKRIRDAIIELGDLVELLEREDREQIFNPPQNADASYTMMHKAAMQVIQLAYLGMKPTMPYPTELVENAIKEAENQYSIETTGRQNHAEVELTVTPNVQDVDIDELADRFREDPSELSRHNLTELLMAVSSAESALPDITIDDIAEAIRERAGATEGGH